MRDELRHTSDDRSERVETIILAVMLMTIFIALAMLA